MGWEYDQDAEGSNLQVGVRGTSGWHWHDTGYSVPSNVGDWITLNLFLKDAATASPELAWSIQDGFTLQEYYSGIYEPGEACLNASSGNQLFYSESQAGADWVVEKLCFYTHPGSNV